MKGTLPALLLAISALAACPLFSAAQSGGLRVTIASDGRYSLGTAGGTTPVLTAGVAAEVNGQWLRSTDYPHHTVRQSEVQGHLGAAAQWDVTFSGRAGAPSLNYQLRAFRQAPFAEIQVTVDNTSGSPVHVEAIRAVDADSGDIIDLHGPAAQDRVLSDSFSEDRPAVKIHDLADAEGQMHRGVGSQLIYNRQSHESLFVGALTSERFLTILRLHLASTSGTAPRLASWEVDSTGTTEEEKENSLRESPAEDQIELSLPVASGAKLASEELLFSIGDDYHHQLETYGSLIRQIHHARTAAPPLMGWWSWTAFYFGLNNGAALTNAQWESEHLKALGYNVFHIDEGYQYARGEYTTPNATLFPDGMNALEYKVRGLGLLPGIWTAPFEVTNRSWVFEHHSDWLVKNALGQPIPAGHVTDHKDQIYILDTTNPGAADYLRKTYSTLVHEWGIHYIKMDFMDDSAIEGYYYKRNTTALEAQRIGLQIIRDAVGQNVYLDKDGSVMLNPVGYVDYGRISQDTGHTFEATRDAATGIAARYYMNRNFFVSDPDAFGVSKQVFSDQSWHESRKPEALDAARASIALAAVSGGMYEIGDNLPSLENSPDRLKLIENQDLIDMIRLGRASVPVDLLDYSEKDQQPTTFILKESPRQSILTVFNWTGQAADHTIELSRLGLPGSAHYSVTDVLEVGPVAEPSSGAISLSVPPQGVRVLKLINLDEPDSAPAITVKHESDGQAGQTLTFHAECSEADPATSWEWNFGDGVKTGGQNPSHTWTEPGDYDVQVTAHGLSGKDASQQFRVHITGSMSTVFNPAAVRRWP